MAIIQSPFEILIEAVAALREGYRVYDALPFWKRWFTQPPMVGVTRMF